ncbi:release factor glutamine methyltransferase [Clostridium sp. CAG:245]|nr:release factor glutamine methyltransferase [Clostridium sp. CAG:245]
MKIKEVIEEGKNVLSKNNIEDNVIITRELLAFVLGVEKQYLVIHLADELNAEDYIKFKENINKLINGKPLQYITNNQEFMGLNFFVNENVLIPQPDTEIIVEETLKKCKELLLKNGKIRILDLCTGSGAIAVFLSNFLGDEAEVFASDISTKALEVAKYNNGKNNTNVRFIESNLFENIQEQKFDIIVSNPPYIRSDVINKLSKQVQNEPHLALDGGEDGLKFYKKIIEQSCNYIENGYLILEIGYDQKEDVENLLKENKNYSEIKTIQDLSGNDRCVIAKVGKI